MNTENNLTYEDGCNRCGFCCVRLTVEGFPEDAYSNGIKPANTVCAYLTIGDGKASCKLYDSPEKPEDCKNFICDKYNKRRLERLFLNVISNIPPKKGNAFSFYFKMWKNGYFHDFSFKHLLPDDDYEAMILLRDFVRTHFQKNDLPKAIKDIISNPEWYNSWGVRETIEGLMKSSLPMELFNKSKKNPRLKAVLLEWDLFDEIQKTVDSHKPY